MQLNDPIYIATLSSAIERNTNKLAPPSWQLPELAGRLVELSALGNSTLYSFAALLILQAQEAGEPCAWISRNDCHFYPPDMDAQGIDLTALPIIQSPTFHSGLRSLERLLRSGAFSLIILDHSGHKPFPLHAQGRLSGLALKHHTTVLTLCEKGSEHGSMGSMVGLHAQAMRKNSGHGIYRCTLHALKDKRRGPHWQYSERVYAPPGLY